MSSDVMTDVAQLLFGDGGENLIRKMNPAQSDLSTSAKKDRKQRTITAGLSAVGGTAGAAGLGYAGHKMGGEYRRIRAATKGISRGAAAAKTIRGDKFGAALIPLEVAGLGGEVMATHILHNDTKKKKPGLVRKDIGEIMNNSSVPSKRHLVRAAVTSPKTRKKGMEYTKKTSGILRKLPNKVVTTNEVEKSAEVDVVWSGDISKANADKQQIFGWASVVEVNGEPVLDLQGDYISPEEMEKAAYTYVQKSRKGGDMHLQNNWEPIQKSEMIESFIVTPEKREAMGLPESMPTGWWVGFQVQDPELWSDIKGGKRTGFSIHGKGRREAMT